MKYVLPLLLAALWLLAGCGGADTATPATTPGGGLAGLPAPREVSVGESVLHMQPGTRSYLTSTMTYVDLSTSRGVSTDPDTMFLRFEPSADSNLAYTLFGISALIDSPAVLDKVSLEIAWSGAAPTGAGQGFYVGLADYRRNTWVWRGPARTPSDLLDFATAAISDLPLGTHLNNMALVNYSDQTAVLRSVNFSTVNPNDVTGDEALYYISDAGGFFTIQRAPLTDLDSSAPVYAPGAGVELSNMQIGELGGYPVLFFDRRPEGGLWEVWTAGLDGSAPALRYSDAQQDVRFGGQDLAGGRDYIMRGNYPQGSIERLDAGTGVADAVSQMQAALDGAPHWYGNFHSDFALGATSSGDPQPKLLGIYKSLDLNTDYYVPLLPVVYAGASQDPAFASWANGQFGDHKLIFYSGKWAGEEHYSIRLDDLSLVADQNNKIFIPAGANDLRYPSLSPDSLYFSFVVCAPGANLGELYVQSAFLRQIDTTAAIASGVSGPAVWYDPTPPVPDQ
jgi:hypothetical protein